MEQIKKLIILVCFISLALGLQGCDIISTIKEQFSKPKASPAPQVTSGFHHNETGG